MNKLPILLCLSTDFKLFFVCWEDIGTQGLFRNNDFLRSNFTKSTIKQPQPVTLIKKTLAQVFSCEFCEISKNTFSYRTPPVAASVMVNKRFFQPFHSNAIYFSVNSVFTY